MSDLGDNIKRIIVNTGPAKKEAGRKTRRRGGGGPVQEDGTIIVQKEPAVVRNAVQKESPAAPPTAVATPVTAEASATPVAPVTPTAGGGKKVILSKTKKVTKVILGSPKLIPHHKRNKTLKHFKVNTGGLSARLRRAKTIKKHADATSLESVKKELVAANLIKADTKAPESVLRQIYTDFMVLRKKAL